MKRTKILMAIAMLFLSIPTFIMGGCENKENLTTYKIDCVLSGDVLTGKECVEFYNSSDNAFKEIKFNLFGNAFREDAKYSPISKQYESRAYIGGKNYGEMNINKVYDESGKDLEFAVGGVDENILIVCLSDEVYPEESVVINIEYTLHLADVIARTGINEKTINLSCFYPIVCGIEDGEFYECVYYPNGDPFFSECSNYEVKITLPSEYVIASSGKLVDFKKAGAKNVSTYKIDKARSFAFVLSRDYESIVDTTTGVEITYYFYDDENPLSSIKTAVDAMNTFTRLFGEYPYETYSVCQTKLISGGMEYPALVYISDELTSAENAEVIVHETAHQWWQTAVGNNEVEYGFLDEGLAEYSVILFYENNPSYKVEPSELIDSAEKSYKMFCSVYDKIFGDVDTSMTRSLGKFSSEYEYVNIAYIKPCIMYDTLRETIGDAKFFNALKDYYRENTYKIAYPDDLKSAFINVGADTNGFFDGFYSGKAIL